MPVNERDQSAVRQQQRVLFIVSQPFFQWRGSPIRVGFDVQALGELGYAVDLLTLPFGLDREIEGVQILRVSKLPGIRDIPIGPSIRKACFDVLLYLKARALIRRRVYDVIHCVEDTGLLGISLARRAGAVLVFEKHSDPDSYRKPGFRNVVMSLYARAEATMIRHADAVIGTGPGLAAQARVESPGKTVVHIPDIPSSLAEATEAGIRQARAELKVPAEAIVLTYVGSFAAYQGIELLFAAIPLVCRCCREARFVIIGGSEAEINARRDWLHEQGCAGAVIFAGKCPPDLLPNLLGASDILLSPRLTGRNTPLKLLDYLKAGRAIMATDNEANRQILDEHTALFAEPEPAPFAEGLCKLATDAGLRERLAAGGSRMIADTYNFGTFKRGLEAVYREALDGVRH